MKFNGLKTVALLAGLTGILLLIGSFWGYNGLILAFIFAMVINFISYWFSDKIALRIYKAKEAKVEDYRRLHQMINEIAKKADVPKPRVYVIPSKAANAFATGRNPKHAAIAVTEGLMELLTEKELKGVIAHEFAHIKNRDILVQSVAAVIASVITFIAFMARWGAIFGGYQRGSGRGFIELIALAILAPLAATVIRLAISRTREYGADATGAKTIKDSKSLASALKKLEANVKHRPLRFGSETTSNFFIVNPFRSSFVWKMFSTHPDTNSRIARLNKLKF